jgi:spore maturation protein B
MAAVIRVVSMLAIPVFILFILGYGFAKKVPVYEAFVEGAREGFTTAIRVLPYLVAMFVAIGMFRASGAMDFIVGLLAPIAGLAGIPAEMLPLALMRPMSGMASTGMLAEIFKVYGPDSFIGRVSSTMMGSTETVFYTISVYFGAVGIKKIKYTLWAALLADLTGLLVSVAICSLVFGRG